MPEVGLLIFPFWTPHFRWTPRLNYTVVLFQLSAENWGFNYNPTTIQTLVRAGAVAYRFSSVELRVNKFAIDNARAFSGRRQQPQHEQDLHLVVERNPVSTSPQREKKRTKSSRRSNIKVYSQEKPEGKALTEFKPTPYCCSESNVH